MKKQRHMRKPASRRLVQLYAALLYNANLKGFISGSLYQGSTKAVCVPGLNCYSCPGAAFACPLGSLQNALASSGHGAGWYVFGILLLFGITLGRTVCGWLCPVGLIQELLYRIPVPKIRKSRITRILSYLKYVVLVVFVVIMPLWYGLAHNMPLPGFCKYICPAGTGEGALMLLSNSNNTGMFAQLGVFFTRKFVILILIITTCIFCYRSFCRFLCPLGAIYGLFNRFAVTGMKVEASRCNGCGSCIRNCQMDVRRVSDHECISCGKCMEHCPQGALTFQCGKVVLRGPEQGKNADAPEVIKKRKRRGRILWGIALSFLIFVLYWVHMNDTLDKRAVETEAATEIETVETGAETAAGADMEKPENETEISLESEGTTLEDEWSSDALVGHEPGQQLEDFTCTLLNGETFHLSDFRGSVVIINQWATYCTPCVGELPYFEQLKEEHPEIVILAFHHWLEAKPSAADYIEQQGWTDWGIEFAVDTKDENILSKIGGDNTMPRTVVLNKRGEVVYNEQRSVTYEMLETLLSEAAQ